MTDRGWHIDPTTLREVVTDEALLRAQLTEAPAADRVWLLRLLGDLAASAREGEQVLDAAADRFRPLLLLAHTLQWQGRWRDAGRLQKEALLLADTPGREATARQHIGKRLVDEGRYAEAAEQFAVALRLRQAAGAGEDLVASSRMALVRAQALAAGSAADAPDTRSRR
ncbi:MAG: tetratricopeptide repeat protein [Actinotalea sp.]|nr:tetratricopeptide repeat protein [Actinotalea sp.]